MIIENALQHSITVVLQPHTFVHEHARRRFRGHQCSQRCGESAHKRYSLVEEKECVIVGAWSLALQNQIDDKCSSESFTLSGMENGGGNVAASTESDVIHRLHSQQYSITHARNIRIQKESIASVRAAKSLLLDKEKPVSEPTNTPVPPDLSRHNNYRTNEPGAVAIVGMIQANGAGSNGGVAVPDDDEQVEQFPKESSAHLLNAELVPESGRCQQSTGDCYDCYTNERR